MNKIEVAVINHPENPAGMMTFLARLTQRGHNIKTMQDLSDEYFRAIDISKEKPKLVEAIAKLPHGTIKRFTPITVAIVGASRRFLAQARTHQVGLTYVSASLQYSDYSGKADFVVPYALMEADEEAYKIHGGQGTIPSTLYLESCGSAMRLYEGIADLTDNDTAGYIAPQGLRNILIMQGNHESWMNFINRRACNRNTTETQYVTLRIWEELLKTQDGKEMFKYAGPDCSFGRCREGKMSCGSPVGSNPTELLDAMFPLIRKGGTA